MFAKRRSLLLAGISSALLASRLWDVLGISMSDSYKHQSFWSLLSESFDRARWLQIVIWRSRCHQVKHGMSFLRFSWSFQTCGFGSIHGVGGILILEQRSWLAGFAICKSQLKVYSMQWMQMTDYIVQPGQGVQSIKDNHSDPLFSKFHTTQTWNLSNGNNRIEGSTTPDSTRCAWRRGSCVQPDIRSPFLSRRVTPPQSEENNGKPAD